MQSQKVFGAVGIFNLFDKNLLDMVVSKYNNNPYNNPIHFGDTP